MAGQKISLETHEEDYGRGTYQVFVLKIPAINILELGQDGKNLLTMVDQNFKKSGSVVMTLRALALLAQEIERGGS